MFVVFQAREAVALGEPELVSDQPSDGSFALVANGTAAAIYVDTNDFWGVQHAAEELRDDIKRVTGSTPDIVHSLKSAPKNLVVIGTLGKCHILENLVHGGNISSISGKWETFQWHIARHPFPGVENALVVAGSDKRGAIFGTYHLSEQIGVSPWRWWTDAQPRHKDSLFVKATDMIQGPPAVKYRGIFLNDEAPDLTGWVNEKFGGYNHAFYTNVFDLLLRLRANYLWPAMWNNCFAEDDSLNAKLADDYGIVMGTSHVEPMMRADKEWNRLGFTAKDWNFETHDPDLRKFWKEGLERQKNYENIITIAMRGKIDTPMSESANIAASAPRAALN